MTSLLSIYSPARLPTGLRKRMGAANGGSELREDHILAEEVKRIQKSMDKEKGNPEGDRD